MMSRIKRFFGELLQALKVWLNKPRSLATSLGFTWIHMLCTFGAVSVLLVGMGESIPFWMIMGLWSATYFITLLPISINGLGVQEVALTYLFTNYGGVSLHSVLAMALLMRALPILASLPGAVFLPALLQPKKAEMLG